MDYIHGFVLMDLKHLNAIEYNSGLEILRNFCGKNHNIIGIVHTICNQIDELEKLLDNDVNKIAPEKIDVLRLYMLLTAL